MLLSLKAKNCFLFKEEIELSMRVDAPTNGFAGSVADIGGVRVLKSAIVLGPNNAGKTNLTRCIRALRDILLNRSVPDLTSNVFTPSEVCELAARFVYDEHQYAFEVRYDARNREFTYERLSEFESNGNVHTLYERDIQRQVFRCEDALDLAALLPHVSTANILIYLLDVAKFPVLDRAKKVLTGFASRIDVVDMDHLSLRATVEYMKDAKSAEKVRKFVLDADLSLQDFRIDGSLLHLSDLPDDATAQLFQLNGIDEELLSLVSVYDDVPVPSILFDSRGTQTIEAIAPYVIDALEHGRILVLDGLDSSLHFQLARAIVCLFNNRLNKSAQLIATTHDPMRLNCRKLFREEQVWFAHRDDSGAYLYSLADFSADQHGASADAGDLLSKYKAGVFGAVPDPDLFPLLMDGHDE